MAVFKLAKLVNRKLIKISGPDVYPYLQGLLCNDLRYLYEPERVPRRIHAIASTNALSTFMLNAQGRAICDMLLYRTPLTRYECEFTPPGKATDPDELLIECDTKLAEGVANILYGYRVRRKVSLAIINNQDVWCLYPNLAIQEERSRNNSTEQSIELIKSDVFTPPPKEILENNLTIVCDPRLKLLGLRIISDSSAGYKTISEILKSRLDITEIQESNIKDYILHRYRLGVGEGLDDHPDGGCLPLECNADLLNSVSFKKGCYLGQELTARVHYTGVIRKRLMPISLTIDKSAPPPALPILPGSDIVDVEANKKIGTLRHTVRGKGLALIRHDLLKESSQLIHDASRVPLTVWKPYWWQATPDTSEPSNTI